MLHTIAAATLLVLIALRDGIDADGATCNSLDVTDPTSLRNVTGWDSQDPGAGARRQGQVSAEIVAWGEEQLVVYGGTSVRNDDTNDVFATESRVMIFDTSLQEWVRLEMVGEILVQSTVVQTAVSCVQSQSDHEHREI